MKITRSKHGSTRPNVACVAMVRAVAMAMQDAPVPFVRKPRRPWGSDDRPDAARHARPGLARLVARPARQAPRRSARPDGAVRGVLRRAPAARVRVRHLPGSLRRPLPRVQLQLHVPRRGRPPRAPPGAGHPHRRQPRRRHRRLGLVAAQPARRRVADRAHRVARQGPRLRARLARRGQRRARGHDRVGAPGRGRDRARQELEAAGRAQALARRRRPLPRRAVPARRHLQVPLGAEGGRVQRRRPGAGSRSGPATRSRASRGRCGTRSASSRSCRSSTGRA